MYTRAQKRRVSVSAFLRRELSRLVEDQRGYAKARCFLTDKDGRVIVGFPGNHPVAVLFRIRAEWGGNREALAGVGVWKKLVFVNKSWNPF